MKSTKNKLKVIQILENPYIYELLSNGALRARLKFIKEEMRQKSIEAPVRKDVSQVAMQIHESSEGHERCAPFITLYNDPKEVIDGELTFFSDMVQYQPITKFQKAKRWSNTDLADDGGAGPPP